MRQRPKTDSQVRVTHQQFQNENGLIADRRTGSSQSIAPKLLDSHQQNTRAPRLGELPHWDEKTLSHAPKLGPTNNCDGFYQFLW